MHAVFADRARIQAMLDFEAALARAEAACGIISEAVVEPIAAQCDAALYDPAELARAAALAGNLAIPLVRQLTLRVAAADQAAAGAVHWGATSQDVIDTGLMLQLRGALQLIEGDVCKLVDALVRLTKAERDAVMSGRTWLQQAVPVTLGLKGAGWLDALLRHQARLSALDALLVIQFGGAAGTLASLGQQGPNVAQALARALGLGVPDMPWHTERDRIVEVASTLGMLVGTLGKMARDVALLMQTEVGEAFEPQVLGRGASSTMPHKQNPVASANVLSAALRVPGLVATLLGAMVQEHERGLGGWHAEWEVVPEVFRLTAGALEQTAAVMQSLSVDRSRMQANLARTGGIYLAEAVTMALAPALGRSAAHSLLEDAVRTARDTQRPLRAILDENVLVKRHLSSPRLDELLDPSRYLGSAQQFIDAVLARADACKQKEAG